MGLFFQKRFSGLPYLHVYVCTMERGIEMIHIEICESGYKNGKWDLRIGNLENSIVERDISVEEVLQAIREEMLLLAVSKLEVKK